jgi:hypothetical protein
MLKANTLLLIWAKGVWLEPNVFDWTTKSVTKINNDNNNEQNSKTKQWQLTTKTVSSMSCKIYSLSIYTTFKNGKCVPNLNLSIK